MRGQVYRRLDCTDTLAYTNLHTTSILDNPLPVKGGPVPRSSVLNLHTTLHTCEGRVNLFVKQ
jgi:hypothetical protein